MAAQQEGTRLSARTVARWAIVIPASVVLGWLFSMWHVPAAWILAAILSSGAMALFTGEDLHVNRSFYSLSRGFIGIMAAIPLTVVPVGQLLGFLPAADNSHHQSDKGDRQGGRQEAKQLAHRPVQRGGLQLDFVDDFVDKL